MRSTWLLATPEGLALLDESEDTAGTSRPLPRGAIEATFARYGKELDRCVEPSLATTPTLPIELVSGAAALLRHLRFVGWGSVHPADYLVLEVAGQETVAAPAPLVAGALRALALAALRASR